MATNDLKPNGRPRPAAMRRRARNEPADSHFLLDRSPAQQRHAPARKQRSAPIRSDGATHSALWTGTLIVAAFGLLVMALLVFNAVTTPRHMSAGDGRAKTARATGTTLPLANTAAPTATASMASMALLPTATPGYISQTPGATSDWFVDLIFTATSGPFDGQAGAHGGVVACGVWNVTLAKDASVRIPCPISAAKRATVVANSIHIVDYGAIRSGFGQTLTVTNPGTPYVYVTG
jgi:hypothetical protein